MNNKDYMEFVRRTKSERYDMLLAVAALAEEAGELCGVVKKSTIYPKFEEKYGISARDKMIDEAGDVLYQLCVVLDLCGVDLDTVASLNHTKLIARHGGEGVAEDGGKRD